MITIVNNRIILLRLNTIKPNVCGFLGMLFLLRANEVLSLITF